MIKLFLALLFLSNPSLQTCSTGCLKCSTNLNELGKSVCLVCDQTLGYYLDGQTCSSSKDTACLKFGLFGNCYLCDENYFFDQSANRCMPVNQQNTIPNCKHYNPDNTCRYCQSGFVIENNVCNKIESPIVNCAYQTVATECAECEAKFYISADFKKCTAIPYQENCISYSNIECQECESGYLYDKNVYQRQLLEKMENDQTQMVLDLITTEYRNEYLFDTSIKKCEKKMVDNCKEFTRFDRCKVCNAGYYIDKDYTCAKNPLARINNCLVYNSLTNCQQCQNGYYRKNAYTCERIKPSVHIQRCQKYSQTKSIVQCEKCEQEFYLQDNVCKPRANQPILHCQTYQVTQDACATCNVDYVLSSDSLQCLQQILNCKQHEEFTSNSKQSDLKCEVCVQTHYLHNGECLQGTQKNCQTYHKNLNQCIECQNGFFSIPECIDHSPILECEAFKKDAWNYCDKCASSSINLKIEHKCDQLPEIANCKDYLSNEKLSRNLCDNCEEGFYKDNSLFDQRCLGILTTNCATAEDNTGKCLTCKKGYGLAKNKKETICMAPHVAITANCEEDGVVQSGDNVNNFQCTKCKEGTTPLVKQYSFFPPWCISTSYLNFMPKYFNKQTTFRAISNCAQYIEHEGAYPKCNKCVKGFFVSLDEYSCVRNFCQADETTKKTFTAIKLRSIGSGSSLRNYVQPERCNSDEQDNHVYAPRVGPQDGVDIILQCKHKVKVVDFSDEDHSNVNPQNQEKDWISHHLDIHLKVFCPNSTTNASINGATAQDITSNIPQCMYFLQSGPNAYQCLRCPLGQHFSQIPSADNNLLSSCKSMTTCDNSVQYKNIKPHWQKLFSCHQCVATNEIPVLAIDSPSKTSPDFTQFSPFSLTNHNWKGTTTDRSTNLFCMNVNNRDSIITKLSLEATYNDSGNPNYAKLETLTNCGLAVLNLQYSNSFDNSDAMKINNTVSAFSTSNDTALLCAQCKPGYKNVYYSNQEHFVSYCEAITGCDYTKSQSWFGACSQCQDGKTYAYESDQIKWDTCVDYANTRVEYQNCLAVEISSSESWCRVCKKGYTLNPENHHCEKLTVPTCQQNAFRNTNIKMNKNLAYFLYLHQYGSGCTSCDSGMINIASYNDSLSGDPNKDFINVNICVKSDLVLHTTNFQDLTFYDTGTTFKKPFYINHCLIYQANRNVQSTTVIDFSSHQCSKCADGYILRDGGKKCEAESYSPNCALLNETDQNCITCDVGYALQRNAVGTKVCVLGQINNCQSYFQSQLFGSVRCKECDIGYYFKDGKCVEGKVPNCNHFESDYICTECNENYWLVGEADTNNVIDKGYYCLKKDVSLNCKTAYFTGNTFHCTHCENGSQKLVENSLTQFAQKNVEILQTKCIQYSPIQNCEVHAQVFLLKKKSLYCEKCTRNYFVQNDGYSCVKRTNLQDSCSEYVAAEDKCAKCVTGYFLDPATTKCMINPVGDLGCRKYQLVDGNLKCLSCGDGQYLEGQECLKVSVDNKIPQCQYYLSATQCEQCYGGFFLDGNSCENITVQHCVEYINANSCQKCKDGYRLLDQGEITICQLYDKLNCVEFDQLTLKCKICSNSFYPDENGDCVQVVPQNQILDCMQYRKDQLCARCGPDHVLSLDFKKCNAKGNFDAHCTQQRNIEIWDCNVCESGFSFVGELCKNYNDSIQGCFIRDVQNQKKCAICKSGFYMERGQNCAKNI